MKILASRWFMLSFFVLLTGCSRLNSKKNLNQGPHFTPATQIQSMTNETFGTKIVLNDPGDCEIEEFLLIPQQRNYKTFKQVLKVAKRNNEFISIPCQKFVTLVQLGVALPQKQEE